MIDVSKLSDNELEDIENQVFKESMKRSTHNIWNEGKKRLILHIAWRDHYFNEFNEWNVIGINPSTCPHPEEYIESVGGITAICTKCGEYYDDIDEGQNLCGTK